MNSQNNRAKKEWPPRLTWERVEMLKESERDLERQKKIKMKKKFI